MKDQLLKALVLNEHVRLYIVRTTDLVQEAQDRFDLHPCACAALGRTLSVAKKCLRWSWVPRWRRHISEFFPCPH